MAAVVGGTGKHEARRTAKRRKDTMTLKFGLFCFLCDMKVWSCRVCGRDELVIIRGGDSWRGLHFVVSRSKLFGR